MRYKINCGVCEKEIVAMGENDEEGMKDMKEEAQAHNSLRHPEARPMTEEELEEDIRGKWRKEA